MCTCMHQVEKYLLACRYLFSCTRVCVCHRTKQLRSGSCRRGTPPPPSSHFRPAPSSPACLDTHPSIKHSLGEVKRTCWFICLPVNQPRWVRVRAHPSVPPPPPRPSSAHRPATPWYEVTPTKLRVFIGMQSGGAGLRPGRRLIESLR